MNEIRSCSCNVGLKSKVRTLNTNYKLMLREKLQKINDSSSKERKTRERIGSGIGEISRFIILRLL